MKNKLGELRRTAVVATFGPGAIIDFRADQATISAVAAGLEEWDKSFPPAGLRNPQCIFEPRLQKKLGVQGFRLPPAADALNDQSTNNALVATRFPGWLQCPRCNRIAPQKKWNSEPGKAFRYCALCTTQEPGRGRCFVIPVRFVMACKRGHLDDFPWHWWVGHLDTCTKRDGFLQLDTEAPGHAGLILSCPECKARRSMDGIFSTSTWERFALCSGKRPWLAAAPESCDLNPQAVQRGASNLYFPVIESALSIPPWSDKLQEVLGIYWDPIVQVSNSEHRVIFVKTLAESVLAPALRELRITPEQLVNEIERRLVEYARPEVDLKEEEYKQFISARSSTTDLDREFEIRNVTVPTDLDQWFSRIVKVVRLREVRALRGFTRIVPPGDEENQEVAALSLRPMEWLPAIEVRGEGIFLELNQKKLAQWEQDEQIQKRAQKIDSEWIREWRQRYGPDSLPPSKITARFLLLHTFSHVLMRQLTLDCGYSSASLRERVYSGDDESAMSGVLIFTATSDADGTLGGLQRQADSSRIATTIKSAIASTEWCSSDPLCIQDVFARPNSFLLAACHACVLAPETSCEYFNQFLDRALLIGNLDCEGFFSNLLSGAEE